MLFLITVDRDLDRLLDGGLGWQSQASFARIIQNPSEFSIAVLQTVSAPPLVAGGEAIVDTAVWVQNIDSKMLKNEQSLRSGRREEGVQAIASPWPPPLSILLQTQPKGFPKGYCIVLQVFT